VLLVHLITFRVSFPSDKDQVPERVMRALVGRLERREANSAQGARLPRDAPLRQQYLPETTSKATRRAEDEVQGWTGIESYPVTPPAREGRCASPQSVICTAARHPPQRSPFALREMDQSRMSSSWQAI